MAIGAAAAAIAAGGGTTVAAAAPGSLAEFCGEGTQFYVFHDGRLSPCFVHVFLFGPLFLIFVICASFRLKQVVSLPMPAPRPLSRQQVLKLVLTSMIAGYNLVLFAVLSAFDFGRPYQWLMYPMACLTWLFCVVVLIAEAKYGLPTNWVLRTFWIISFIFASFELCANITTDQAKDTPYFAAFLVHYVLYLGAAIAAVAVRESQTTYSQLPLDFSEITFDDVDMMAAIDRDMMLGGSGGGGGGLGGNNGGLASRAGKLFPIDRIPIRRLVMLFRRERWFLGGGLGCCLIGAPIEVIQFIYIGLVLDDVAVPEGPTSFAEYVGVLVLLYIIEALASGIQLILFMIAGERMACRLRRTAFNAVLSQEVGFLEGSSQTSEIVKRLNDDVGTIQHTQTMHLSMWLQSMIQILVGSAFLVVLSWKLTLVCLAVIPFIALMMLAQATVMQSFSKRTLDWVSRVEEMASEILTNMKTVRGFARENKEKARYGAEVLEANRMGKKMAVAHSTSEGLGVFVLKMCGILGIFYGGSLVHHHELSGGVLVSFVFIGLQVVMAFSVVLPIVGSIGQSIQAGQRIFELLDREPEINTRGGLTLPSIEGRLEFKNVTFSYPAHPDVPVLNNLNVLIDAGHTVAICGPPRSGKSTLIALAQRLYDPQDGLVLLDDTDISTFDPLWLRQQIGVVAQEPVLFSSYTIAENIAYGIDARQEQIQQVAEQVDLHEIINKIPHGGYRAIFGTPHVKLNQGEKQRIAIARVLLRNPKILLLDEAAGGLDAESEVLVQQALSRATQGRTVVVVAHRLQTVRNADLIVFLKNGMVVEAGDHMHLMTRTDGHYRRMWERQVPVESGDWAEEDELSGRNSMSQRNQAAAPFLPHGHQLQQQQQQQQQQPQQRFNLSSNRTDQLVDDLETEIKQLLSVDRRGGIVVGDVQGKLLQQIQQLKLLGNR